mmetsp:Transcript_19756/g.46385  ORF Transcript_19756/g.46385 Transcript_19756/m.46385 type:complete len:118 (-) Transcript_19756:130-483(-)
MVSLEFQYDFTRKDPPNTILPCRLGLQNRPASSANVSAPMRPSSPLHRPAAPPLLIKNSAPLQWYRNLSSSVRATEGPPHLGAAGRTPTRTVSIASLAVNSSVVSPPDPRGLQQQRS